MGYGTAGFRCKSKRLLGQAAFRIGVLAAFRAKHTGAAGVMVTASHNTAEDNGVKIIERDGGMLSRDWEDLAEMIMNAHELSETIANLNKVWIKGFLFDVNVLATERSPDPWAKA